MDKNKKDHTFTSLLLCIIRSHVLLTMQMLCFILWDSKMRDDLSLWEENVYFFCYLPIFSCMLFLSSLKIPGHFPILLPLLTCYETQGPYIHGQVGKHFLMIIGSFFHSPVLRFV